MSPIQTTPKRSPVARIALRRIAVPAEQPRVFPIFEEMYRRALRAAEEGRAAGGTGLRAATGR